MGGMRLTEMQLWREFAHWHCTFNLTGDRPVSLCQRERVDDLPSNQITAHCQYRYPSPRRFGPIGPGPTLLLEKGVTLSADKVVELRRSSRMRKSLLESPAQTADSAPHKQKQHKGRTPCFHSVSSLRPRPSHRFPHVSTMILNAASPVPQRAQLSPTRSALTSQPGPSLVVPQVRFVTRSRKSAANPARLTFAAPIGRRQTSTRRAGHSPVRRFAFRTHHQGAVHV